MNKSPAFQFYPSDFLSDENVVLMTNREIGCYIKLLSHCWLEGSIPKDTTRLSRLCGESESDMVDIMASLDPCFKENGKTGRLVNPRLERERLKQEAFRQGQSEAGKRAMKSRWGKAKNKLPISKLSESVISSDNSSSSSSSSISNKTPLYISTPFGQFQNVKLTKEEHDRLISEFGESGTKERIENLSSYIASKGKKYKSHYATILTWERKNPKQTNDSLFGTCKKCHRPNIELIRQGLCAECTRSVKWE